MKTQSADTHPTTEQMMIYLIRNAPMSKRFRLVQSLTQGTVWANMQVWRQRHQGTSEQEAAVEVLSRWYGPLLAARVQAALALRKDWQLQPTDLLTVMLPALRAFDEQNIFWYLGGSIASSMHGMQQMAQDIDLVADIDDHHLSSLLCCLKPHYVFDEQAFQEAVYQRLTCSLIHLDTLMKVDVVVAKHDAFATTLHRSVAPCLLDERYPSLQVASATEMILVKLRRYSQDVLCRTDGMRDDAQWNDIVGMLKVQGPVLERDILEDWARTLKITEMLRQALIDAGAEHTEAA